MKIAEDPKLSLESFRSACLLLQEKLSLFTPDLRRVVVEELLFNQATVKAALFDKLKPDSVRTAPKRTRSGSVRQTYKATEELKRFLE